ncbi:hypothetical protein ACDF64_09175 [Agromyces sp. MMS24-JH15]|uniref:hypothetical protein n=1 Tax=Agromyces sp. MMS24-JH15 TaxID=3243765 RepID=UPI0037495A99
MSTARSILRCAAGGALLVNAIPQGTAGVRGEPFPTPFASPPGVGLSAPVVNVAWSAVNAVVAAVLLGRGIRTPGERVAVALGAVAMAFVVAFHFGSVRAGGRGLRGVGRGRARS